MAQLLANETVPAMNIHLQKTKIRPTMQKAWGSVSVSDWEALFFVFEFTV